MAKRKIQITVEDELVQQVDEYAKKNFTSRSGIFCLGASQVILASQMRDAIQSMAHSIKRIADSGTVSEEQLEEIKQFMGFAAVFTGK